MVASKRGNGEGSVYRRKNGRWVAQVLLGYRDGKPMRKYLYGATQREVEEKRRAVQRQIDSNLPVPDERLLVSQFLSTWVEEVAPRSVKASTADGYAWMLRRYVVPHIGHIRLARLHPQDVERMLSALIDSGLSPRTVRQARAILRRAVSYAERYGMVSRNVVALVQPPSAPLSTTHDALTHDEARALLHAAAGDRFEALVSVALTLGLRRGEALGLRWDCVDLDAGTLTVAHTLKRRVGHGLVLDSPKTKGSAATIPLTQMAIKALRRRRVSQAEERLAAGAVWQDTGFVFTTPVGTPLDPRNMSRWYHALTESAGLGRRRFHALRHSAATLMYEQGVPIEVISDMLRHAGLSITKDVYVSFRPDMQRRGVDAMDALLGG